MRQDKRRRKEHRTNYKKRLNLLKSKKTRLVIRKTNKFIILQIVKSQNAKDSVLASTTTRELLKYGWPENKKGGLKSLKAAYLGGFLIGVKSSISDPLILDTGLIPTTPQSRVFAAAKGALDSGLKLKFNDADFKDKLKSEEVDSILNKIKQGK